MASNQSRAIHRGKAQLVIAIDVGTTFSGASYTFQLPNEIPRVYCVTGFKGQEDQPMSTKVPTVLYYDDSSKLVACGSEPFDEDDDANESLTKVEWFKLLMRPPGWKIALQDAPVTFIPEGLGVEDFLSDFLHYMKGCVRDYIFETHVDGRSLWASLIDGAIFILTHPNGWEGYQQSQMRQAAIKSGLITDTAEGRARLEFVTEGEASFHWCVDNGLTGSSLSVGNHVIVADAGGGTIDVSCFRVVSVHPLQLSEASSAQCRVAGSVFVTKALETMVYEKLNGSKWATSDRIDRMVEEFDRKGKCLFRDDSATTYVRLGNAKDNDPAKGIKVGKLAITGREVAATFEKSCRETAEAIRAQMVGKSNAKVFLVGGFAASPWLYGELKRRLNDLVDELHRAESQTAKAVAHGALVHYLDRTVTARIAKHTYGTSVSWHVNAGKSSHDHRQSYSCPVTGFPMLAGGFMSLVTKGEVVPANALHRQSLETATANRTAVPIYVIIRKYNGLVKGLEFYDMDSGLVDDMNGVQTLTHYSFGIKADQFKDVCTFSATIPAKALQARKGTNGRQHWIAGYDVVVHLGKAELQCYIEWKEKGTQKRSMATSAWEDN